MEEVARKSQTRLSAPPAAEGAPPKLTIEKFADAGITCLKFSGTIDEAFEGKKIARSADSPVLVLDVGGVKKISSFGIREWVDFVAAASQQVKELVLIECAPKVVDQLNMVANFSGSGRVFSFYAPFRCDYCDSEHRVLLDVAHDFEAIRAMKLADRPCPSCKEAMYFDDDGATYFSYVAGQGPFELEPAIAQFLAAKLDYRVGTVEAKLRVDKLISGRVTYLRLSGNLDQTFPRDKLAEGLEGHVLIDLAGIGRIEPAGAAHWRAFVAQVTPVVERLDLIGVPEAFLEKLCGPDDLGAKGHIIDLTLPYGCPACGTSSSQMIDVSQHHAVLEFATAPELHCPACKAAMQCSASEGAMTVLPGLPEPALGKDVARTIAELRARKLDKKPSTALTALQRPGEAPAGSPARGWIAVAAVALVLGAGIVAYLHFLGKPDPGPFGLGRAVASSTPVRPAWLADPPAPGGERCAKVMDHLRCVGASLVVASQEDAEDDAIDAAVDAFGHELGREVHDPGWNAVVPPLYDGAREAALGELARDPLSTQARRVVHDGRRAVAQALGIGRGKPYMTVSYWEAFDTPEGRRYVAFATVELAAASAERDAQGYAVSSSALGATTVPFFPELGWRFPRLARGALVTHLAHGPLQDLGLAEHYVVLAIDGRDVADAASFAKIAGEEYAQLTAHGGTLRLLVQTDSGDPREFSKAIAGPAAEPAPARPHGERPADALPVGGINVWDRVGGGH